MPELSARCRGDADHRGGRQRGGAGRPAGAAQRDLPAARSDQPEGIAVGRGIAGDWKGRRGAFGAVGRISPDYLCMDGVIPTSRLPDVLRSIGEMSDAYGLKVANIFHAGDGNLHPLIMFDANDPESFHAAEQYPAPTS